MARGGKREGAGRPKGAVNKATADVREAAKAFTTDALNVLAQIMREGEREASRVAAANSLLDRGHGKPSQTHAGDPDAPIETRLVVTWED